MSGPKSSSAAFSRQLEAEERKRIQQEIEEERRRQQQIEQKKCESLEEEIRKLNQQIKKAKSKLDGYKEKAEELNAETGFSLKNNLSKQEVDQLHYQYTNKLQSVSTKPAQRNSSDLSRHKNSLEGFLRLAGSYFKNLEGPFTEFQEEVKRHQASTEEKDFHKRSESFDRKEIKVFNLSSPSQKEENKESQQEIYDFLNEIEPYTNTEAEEVKKEVVNIYNSIQDILNDGTMSDQDKYEQFSIRKTAFALNKNVYDKKLEKKETNDQLSDNYVTYRSLCVLLEEEPAEFGVFKENDNLLKEKYDLLKSQERTKTISSSIDEVMSELGYDMEVSETITSPQREVFHNVYNFKNGNVINSFTSDDGKVLFEVTGVKETNDLTSLEKLKIKEGMDDFCEEYREIKKKLDARGIELVQENLKPADVRYARAINLNKLSEKSQRSKQKRNPNTQTKMKRG